ncbi:hypothetical protein OS187_11050 [Xanthomonadaceae bacterium JHOS43]|nr:hypothetical protein [Xanthomonadaceae bacterium JHOS43]MCX7562683.1 hypothetical protein [Xanthomonadaceae bacterium XH05]
MKYIFPLATLLAVLPCLAQAQTSAPAPASTAPQESVEAEVAKIRDPAVLTRLVAHARQSGDKEAETAALDRRIALRPHIGAYKLDKVVTLAREDRKSEAYTLLIELQNTGYAFDLRDDERFENIASTQVWGYILSNFEANREPYGSATLAYTLPREDLLAESLAFDPTRKQLLVGSARDGKVFVVSGEGKLSPLVSADEKNGMWAVFDLAVDAKRGFLWVASTAAPHFKNYDAEKDFGRAGIFQFDLKTGKFIKHFLSPPAQGGQPFFLTSVVVGPDGAVYAADGVNRALYQVRDGQFRRILHLPMLTAMSALTVSDDGKRLYVADPQLGIIGLELSTLKPFDVRVPTKLSLEGISSLNWHEGALVIVQAGMNPKRVMRLELSPEGNTIVKLMPIESSNPHFGTLGSATLDGSTLYLVANEQKDNYDRFGLLRSKDKLEATKILRMDADPTPPEAPQAVPMAPVN